MSIEKDTNKANENETAGVDPLVMAPGEIIILRDTVADKLDEMADLCEYWKRRRDQGITPGSIRAALLMLSEEVVMLSKLKP